MNAVVTQVDKKFLETKALHNAMDTLIIDYKNCDPKLELLTKLIEAMRTREVKVSREPHGRGMGGVGNKEAEEGGFESGGGPSMVGGDTAYESSVMALDSADVVGEYLLHIVTSTSRDYEKISILTAILHDEDPNSVVLRIFREYGLFVVQDNTSYFSGTPDWHTLKYALLSAATGRQLTSGGSGGGSSGGVGGRGSGGSGRNGIDEASRLRSSISNEMVDGGRAVAAVTFPTRSLGWGEIKSRGRSTTVGDCGSELQQEGAVAPAGEVVGGGNGHSKKEGAPPHPPPGEADGGGVGSSSSNGNKRKASEGAAEEHDKVYLKHVYMCACMQFCMYVCMHVCNHIFIHV